MRKVIKINPFKSLATRILVIFIVAATTPLVVFGAIEVVTNYSTQSAQVRNLQQEAAKNAAVIIDAYLSQLENEMAMAAQMWVRRGNESGEVLLAELLAYDIGFNNLALIDKTGQEVAKVSRYSLVTPGDIGNRVDSVEFLTAQQGERYLGPVTMSEYGEPFVTLAIPIKDQADTIAGVFLAELSLKYMWDVIGRIETGPKSYAYVVDRNGMLIAFHDPSRVLQQLNLKGIEGVQQAVQSRPIAKVYTGLEGQNVIGNYQPLRQANWFVLVETLSEEALADVYWTVFVNSVIIIATLVLAVLLGWYMTRVIVKPLKQLQEGTAIIGSGNLAHRIDIRTQDEVADLATAFNGMTMQLQQTLAGLEDRVADRTHRLEIVATLGEQLNAILDADELLQEVVNQIKQNFGYYHAHIYLLKNTSLASPLKEGEEGAVLVVAAGTGSAGEQMVAAGHSISAKAATSLVARAVRSGEIVTTQDVQQTKDWLPNPLLPDTRSEMAVPILHKGTVVGVLDVQENKTDGLDESDANLLRSLANQVAVALSNARLFTETTQAREEAEQAKEDIEIANKALEAQVWQTTGQAELNQKMQGEQDIQALANHVIQQICHYLQAQVGTLYVAKDDYLNLVGGYAYASQNTPKQFKFGESLVGQAALEKKPIWVNDVPIDYITINSSLGKTLPKNVMVFPFMYENRVVGVIELGTLSQFTPSHKEFMQTALNNIAIAFNTAQARDRINELLAETQQQAEELQTQSEELRVANEELETQTRSLQASETQLKEKQAVLDQQNRELLVAQQELERKARELATASKYKSEFLANMSHELRTPLNSLLILARMLADNKEGNLTPDQVESAQIIYSGGTDLLNLINDILDLSKVEAGQMVFNFEAMPLADLAAAMRTQFNRVAEEKGLEFATNLAEDLPARIHTDPQRIKQVVKNLLSNAFKFTSQGSISLNIYCPNHKVDLSRSGLAPHQAVAISVADTGIGMTPDQLSVIFEAFQQADGSTSRQFGGTGLGLSISRELAAKLGGQIEVESEPGKGSTFTLYLPIQGQTGKNINKPDVEISQVKQQKAQAPVPAKPAAALGPPPADDRDELAALSTPNSEIKVLAIIEDDPQFAKVVYNYSHQKGFKCLIAGEGKTGLELVKTYQPAAIILDLNLPDMSGWEVLTVLKNDPATRHIPIHIMSADDEVLDAYRRGAMGYLTKPVKQESLEEAFERIEALISRQIKALLIVEDDKNSRRSIKKLLDGSDVQIHEAGRGAKALALLESRHFDCMILDLSLPDMSGFEVLNQMNNNDAIGHCPVIVYTGRDLTPQENRELMQYADSVIVKGVKSPERLLDETALFLHRVVADMPADKQETIQQLYNQDTTLAGKRILIVDDDMRNSFALSKLLADRGLLPKIAHNGQKALDLLAQGEAVDLILMDIMMPVLNGYETIKQIRVQRKFIDLPILALTAKAMKGDREKCLAAGANDYLSKPIDVDRLFSMLRVWLYQ